MNVLPGQTVDVCAPLGPFLPPPHASPLPENFRKGPSLPTYYPIVVSQADSDAPVLRSQGQVHRQMGEGQRATVSHYHEARNVFIKTAETRGGPE